MSQRSVTYLATRQINFQLELLSMIDRQDIEIISIFHLVKSMLATSFYYHGVKIWNKILKFLSDV